MRSMISNFSVTLKVSEREYRERDGMELTMEGKDKFGTNVLYRYSNPPVDGVIPHR